MKELEKYKEIIMYAALIVVAIFFAFKQLQPKVMSTIDLFKQVKSQSEISNSIANQLSTAKEKAERKKKLRMSDDLTKKIYEPNGVATDSESTFAVLLDDIIEITRKNHIKTYSIQSSLNPEDDIFIKGDKEHYSANRLDMKIISDYTDFQNFMEDLYKYPYLVNINTVEIYPYSKNKRILLINFTLTLYATKSAEEAEADKQNEKKEGEGDKPQEGGQPQEGQPEQPQ